MFGDRLKKLRSEKGITQQDLANLLSVSPSTIGMYEQGRRDPDTQTVAFLANYFDVTTDYLLGRTDTRTQPAHDANISTSPGLGNKKINPKMVATLNTLKAFLLNEEESTSRRLNITGTLNVLSLLAGTGPIHPNLELADILDSNELQLTAGGQPLTQERRLNLLRMLDNPALLESNTISNHVPLLGQIKMGIPLLAKENYAGELEIPSDIHADFALEAKGDSMIGVGMLDGDYALCRKQEIAYSGDIVVALKDVATGFSEVTLKYYFNDDEGPVLRAANPSFEDIPLDSNCRIAGVLVAIIRKEVPAYRVYSSYIATRDVNKEMWDPVIEKAFQLGIKPEQVVSILEMIHQTSKKQNHPHG